MNFVFSDKISISYLISFYIVVGSIFGLITAIVEYQAYGTYGNPTKIDYSQYWYNEVPVPQLIVLPHVSSVLQV
jgi:hypothetical protein